MRAAVARRRAGLEVLARAQAAQLGARRDDDQRVGCEQQRGGAAARAAGSSQGLFLYVAFQDAHSPYSAPDKYMARFPQLKAMRLTFNAMVSAHS